MHNTLHGPKWLPELQPLNALSREQKGGWRKEQKEEGVQGISDSACHLPNTQTRKQEGGSQSHVMLCGSTCTGVRWVLHASNLWQIGQEGPYLRAPCPDTGRQLLQPLQEVSILQEASPAPQERGMRITTSPLKLVYNTEHVKMASWHRRKVLPQGNMKSVAWTVVSTSHGAQASGYEGEHWLLGGKEEEESQKRPKPFWGRS